MAALVRLVLIVLTILALTVPEVSAVDAAAPVSIASRRTPSPVVASPASAAKPAWARRLPPSTTQVVRTVSSDFWCAKVYCTVTQAWKKKHGVWTVVKHFRSTIGVNGWGKTHEGDMRSPNGVRRIKVTFSTYRRAPGRMPWKRRRATSAVSSSPGRLYNTWIEQSWRTDGDRPAMRFGFIVNYNRVRLRPYVGRKPIQGRGSGIFYHTSGPGHRWASTQGCTQVGNVDNMRWLVTWLRPGAHPRIVQNQ